MIDLCKAIKRKLFGNRVARFIGEEVYIVCGPKYINKISNLYISQYLDIRNALRIDLGPQDIVFKFTAFFQNIVRVANDPIATFHLLILLLFLGFFCYYFTVVGKDMSVRAIHAKT